MPQILDLSDNLLSEPEQDLNFMWYQSSSTSTTNNQTSSTSAITSIPTTLKSLKSNRPKQRAPSVCSVCNGPTDCLHYGVASCNSCKAFFRRVIVMKKEYECKGFHKNDNCDVKKCKKCRLKKCFKVGMSLNAISLPEGFDMEEVEKISKLYGVEMDMSSNGSSRGYDGFGNTSVKEEEKEEKEDEGNNGDENSGNGKKKKCDFVQTTFFPQFEETDYARRIDYLVYLEEHWQILRKSVYEPIDLGNTSLEQVVDAPCEISKGKCYSVQVHDPTKRKKFWHFSDLMVCIDYLKALPIFHMLDKTDKLVLTQKTAYVQTVFMQYYESYKVNYGTLVNPDGRSPHGFLTRKIQTTKDPTEREMYHRDKVNMENFVKPFYRIEPTEEEYLLVKAILCCQAAMPGLSPHARELLSKEQSAFSMALLRRLQQRLGPMPGAKKYSEVISLIDTFVHFTQIRREYHVYRQSIREMPEPIFFEWMMRN